LASQETAASGFHRTGDFLMRHLAWVLVAACIPPAFADDPIRFRDVSDAAGVTDAAVNSTGPTFVDFDGDGDIDIYIPTEAHQDGQSNRLYENLGDGRFRDVAVALGVDNGPSLARGATWGDYDRDGDQDVYISNMPPSRGRERVPSTLFRNLLKETGKPGFENVTRQANLMRKDRLLDARYGGITVTGGGAAWGDFDNDGWLDLYWKAPDEDTENALFHNNGDGTFTDVTVTSNATIVDKVDKDNAQGSPNWTDVDQDGWIDLLVTVEGDAKTLLLNNRDGTFTDITRSRKPPSGIAFLNPGNAQGACVGDLDNDGDMDFYIPNADQANRVILSELADKGAVSFRDITLTSGADDRGGARGCAMADFDNDGLLDVYVNNGGLSDVLINDVIPVMPVFVQFYIAWEPALNKLYRNNGDGTFTDVTEGSGAEGLGIGSGVGAADLNDDGFPDLFITNRTYYSMGTRVGEPDRNHLLLNQGNDHRWIRVSLEGTRGNPNAYGARVKVVAGDLVQYREHTSAHGYNSGNDPRLLFGLGDRNRVDYVEVTWPGGKTQTVRKPKVGRTVVIREQS
jgi:hypothetical protein